MACAGATAWDEVQVAESVDAFETLRHRADKPHVHKPNMGRPQKRSYLSFAMLLCGRLLFIGY